MHLSSFCTDRYIPRAPCPQAMQGDRVPLFFPNGWHCSDQNVHNDLMKRDLIPNHGTDITDDLGHSIKTLVGYLYGGKRMFCICIIHISSIPLRQIASPEFAVDERSRRVLDLANRYIHL